MTILNTLNRRNVLVTGGTGYIGSHTSRQLVNVGCNVVVVDNFYSGNRWAVPAQVDLGGGIRRDLVHRTNRLISKLLHQDAGMKFLTH